jgi:hypothetical protein
VSFIDQLLEEFAEGGDISLWVLHWLIIFLKF